MNAKRPSWAESLFRRGVFRADFTVAWAGKQFGDLKLEDVDYKGNIKVKMLATVFFESKKIY